MIVYYFLVYIVHLFTLYLGDFTEALLNQHFDTILMLLEEVLDEGLPYTTEPALLKLQIPPPSLLNAVMNVVSLGTGAASSVYSPTAPSYNIKYPWRNNGLKYAHNEIFFDIIEELDSIVDEYNLLLKLIFLILDLENLLLRRLLGKLSVNRGFQECQSYL